jgi:hypothetical protein
LITNSTGAAIRRIIARVLWIGDIPAGMKLLDPITELTIINTARLTIPRIVRIWNKRMTISIGSTLLNIRARGPGI